MLNKAFRAALISAAVSLVRAIPAGTATALPPQPAVPPGLKAIKKTFMLFPELPAPGRRSPGFLVGSTVGEVVGEAVNVALGVGVDVFVGVNGSGVRVYVAVDGKLAVAVGVAGDRVAICVAVAFPVDGNCCGKAATQPVIIPHTASKLRISANQLGFLNATASRLQNKTDLKVLCLLKNRLRRFFNKRNYHYSW
jgi:hypothetical protein